ncbi:MAG TPA: site-specific DNA-methyltransferase [Saprospiraceae bacterium]|nr:site-specific DNA-methyltransferase [Saprospiraceae bacterium]
MALQKIQPSYKFNEEQLKQLRQIAPEAFKDNILDFNTLYEALADSIGDDEFETEHYGLNWPGKKDSKKIAAILSKGTLIPFPSDGVEPETSRNIFIEGENLEVIKLLQKSYADRVKMIYIDPPYNTGKDFVYQDNFIEQTDEYLRRTGVIDSEGRTLTTNTKADGRFHSKWLSMMYPRLKLAKNLLREDGVLFVSIGDDEVGNLKLLLDELFGPECFISMFIWNTDGHTDNQLEVKINHEYILCYQKDSNYSVLNDVIDPNTREDSNLHRGFAENSITKNGHANPASKIKLTKGFPCKVKNLSLPKSNIPDSFFEEVKELGYISREITRKYNCEYPLRLNNMVVKDYKLQEDCEVYAGWANANKLKKFIENGFKPLEEESGNVTFYLSPNGVIYYRRERESAKNILSVLKGFMTTEKMRSTLEAEKLYFSYPKPVDLITYLLNMGLTENDIVMDFFAGSGTTGHALYEYNKKNECASKFILVQMYEQVQANSLAAQNGFKTIDEITRKRLSLYSSKHEAESTNNLGFKFYRYRHSNFKAWKNYNGTDIKQLETLFSQHESSLVDDWKPENLLTEILLIEGFPLDSKIESVETFKKNNVQKVTSDFCEHALFVCLDKKVEDETIKTLSLGDNDIFICLDNAVTDQDKARLDDKGLIKTI